MPLTAILISTYKRRRIAKNGSKGSFDIWFDHGEHGSIMFILFTRSKERKEDMDVFTHHLLEYKKGLRTLVLHTTKVSNRDAIEKKLERERIDCYIQAVNGTKINVFFGNSICIDVIKQMKFTSLSNLTNEEDFILGTMLGYDRVKQCERYLKRKRSSNNLPSCKLKSLAIPKTEAIGAVG